MPPPLVLHSRGGSANPQALKAVAAAAAAGVAMEVRRRLPSDDASMSSLRLELESSCGCVALTQPNAIARFLGKLEFGWRRKRERQTERERDVTRSLGSPRKKNLDLDLNNLHSRLRLSPRHFPYSPRELARVGGDHLTPGRRRGPERESERRRRPACPGPSAVPPRRVNLVFYSSFLGRGHEPGAGRRRRRVLPAAAQGKRRGSSPRFCLFLPRKGH